MSLFPDGWICQDVKFTMPAHTIDVTNYPRPGSFSRTIEEQTFTETFSVPIEGGDYWAGDYNTAVAEMREFATSLSDQSQYQNYEIKFGKQYVCGGSGTFWTRFFSTSIEMFQPKK